MPTLSRLATLCAASAAVFLPAVSSHAQKGPVKAVPKNRPKVISVAPDADQSNYDRLRQSSRATRIVSSQNVRDNYATLAGKTVEIKGRVSGFMTAKQGRTLLVTSEESTLMLDAPAELLDLESAQSLRPGASIRVLATVNAQPEATPLLTVIAATDAPEAEPLFRDAGESESEDFGDVIVPPMTGGTLPPPLSRRPTTEANAKKGARAVPARPSALDWEEQVEAQRPFYEAIVRRHNKKLSPAQVEEIGRALLNAGYQNNMDPRFLAAIIAVESDFDIYCLSSSGAMGLGQLMPFNIPEAGLKSKADAWNPTLNIMGTARLLRGHLNDYQNRPNGTLLAVAAYNAGPGAVRRAGYKVPQGKQVQRYVWKVYYRYKNFAPDMFK